MMTIAFWPALSDPEDCAWKPPMCRSGGKPIDQLTVPLVVLVRVISPP